MKQLKGMQKSLQESKKLAETKFTENMGLLIKKTNETIERVVKQRVREVEEEQREN